MIRQNKALKQAPESLHGLSLEGWLRVVESAESRDREDSASDKRAWTALSDKTFRSHGRPLDTARGPAASSSNAAVQRKRRRASVVSETDTLSEYELARFKKG